MRAEGYTFTVGWNAEDNASAVETPYVMSHGCTPEEAVHNVMNAVASVLEAAADTHSIIIPEPIGVVV